MKDTVMRGQHATKRNGRWNGIRHIGAAALVAVSLLVGCQAVYPMEGFEDKYSIVTFGDVWSPSATIIIDRDGKIVHVIAGEGGVGQISTGAGIAIAGAAIDNGDTTNVSNNNAAAATAVDAGGG